MYNGFELTFDGFEALAAMVLAECELKHPAMTLKAVKILKWLNTFFIIYIKG
jgi:hypothetical protein